MSDRPIANSYWVEPGRLLAGEHPSAPSVENRKTRIAAFLDAGITCFVDLTEEQEYSGYSEVLNAVAERRGTEVQHLRKAIVDMSVPRELRDMVDILDTIDAKLTGGHGVYVHCLAGIGRTGTVIGCYLARHGPGGRDALLRLAELWLPMERSAWAGCTPQTLEQFDMVRYWKEG